MEKNKDKAQQYYEKSKTHKNLKKEIHNLATWCFGISISPFFFWWLYMIPIANIILIIITIPIFITSITLGINAIINISEHPDKYTGKGFAITGIILSTIYILTIIGIITSIYLIL